MRKTYISLDVEMAGPVVGLYSMLSIGMCDVFNTRRAFYRELQPENNQFDMDAMRIGCLGLSCLQDKRSHAYNPRSKHFNPEDVLDVLRQEGTHPIPAMRAAAAWLQRASQGKPIEIVTDTSDFDMPALRYYLAKYAPKRVKLSHRAKILNGWYQGLKRDPHGNVKELRIPYHGVVHNALDDSKRNAHYARAVMKEFPKARL